MLGNLFGPMDLEHLIHCPFKVCLILFMVYYESIKRELNIRLIYECRCDERLKTGQFPDLLGDTGLVVTGTPKLFILNR